MESKTLRNLYIMKVTKKTPKNKMRTTNNPQQFGAFGGVRPIHENGGLLDNNLFEDWW